MPSHILAPSVIISFTWAFTWRNPILTTANPNLPTYSILPVFEHLHSLRFEDYL